MGWCIEDNSAIEAVTVKIFLAVGNMSLHKSLWIKMYEALGMTREAAILARHLANPNMSNYGSIPNGLRQIIQHRFNLRRTGKASRLLRSAGRVSQGLVILAGTLELAVQAHCLGWCCGARHYDTDDGYMWEDIYTFYAEHFDNAVESIKQTYGPRTNGAE